MDPITIGGKIIDNAITEQKNGFILYILISFFGNNYKEYLIKNILIHKEAEIEAQQRFEEKINFIETNPTGIMQAIHNDAELEYKNMFGVLQKTINKINTNNNGSIEPDKLKRLKDLSKEFSSDEMQEYIAGILAGEYNNPGNYSLKTMEIIKSLSKDDLNIFKKFCGLVVDGEFIFGNFFEFDKPAFEVIYKKGITYINYLYLQELGLFTSGGSAKRFGSKETISRKYIFQTTGNNIILEANKEIRLTGICFLTQAGKELMNLVNPIIDIELYNIIKEELITQGFSNIN